MTPPVRRMVADAGVVSGSVVVSVGLAVLVGLAAGAAVTAMVLWHMPQALTQAGRAWLDHQHKA